MRLRLLLLGCVALVLLSSGCIRYVRPTPKTTPSLTESASSALSGEEAFFSVDVENRGRLFDLIEKRRSMSDGSQRTGYHLGPDDLLEINVFDVEELNTTVRIRPSGFISLPLVGAVKAEGRTEADLQDELTKRLSAFVHNPQVHVFVSQFGGNTISILGLVERAGKIPMTRDRLTMLEALSEAGLQHKQPIGPIIIIPNGSNTLASGTEEVSDAAQGVEVYYEDLAGTSGRLPIDVPVLPGDMIIVRPPGTIIVDGEVMKIGPYQPTEQMSVVGAIAAAGGLTYSADINNVEIVRTLRDGGRAMVRLDLEKVMLEGADDIRLRDGDIVRVPSTPGRFVTRQMVDSLNRFLNFSVGGSYNMAR